MESTSSHRSGAGLFIALFLLCSCEVKMKEPVEPQSERTGPAIAPPAEKAVPAPAAAPEPPKKIAAPEVAAPATPLAPVDVVEVAPAPWAPAQLTDEQLLDKVQRQTFRYFWNFGHPVSGLARERDRSGTRNFTLVPFPASCFVPAGGPGGQQGLRGEYFANRDFSGEPLLTRLDPGVNVDWREDSAGGSLPVDGFSVRWTGQLILPEGGDVDVALGSDDGARLYLNGKLIVDNWGDHGFEIKHKVVRLQAETPYDLRVDFYDVGGNAAVQLGRAVYGDEPGIETKAVDTGDDCCAIGGSGMGVMAMIVAADRKWITRQEAAARVMKIVTFLEKAERFHGAFPHWINGTTGKALPFTPGDDGGDLVETSYLMEGLLCARRYFNSGSPDEVRIRNIITKLWEDVDWRWYTQGQNVLYWHWSPKHGWGMNHQIGGWNECLITYVLAACSPTHAIDAKVYHEGWAHNGGIKNGREFLGIKLPLGWDFGGPLFYAHYSFMGLDPRNLEDRYANYWEQNVNHTAINRAYCVKNPNGFKGYGENCWGLTASDNYKGYDAHSPTVDLGVISPTAALSSFPYTPGYSMQALKHFYYNLGGRIWSDYGFVDAFSEQHDWVAESHLAIDQGPIVVMIENYRSGLMWKLFMGVPEVQEGLRKLGFKVSPRR